MKRRVPEDAMREITAAYRLGQQLVEALLEGRDRRAAKIAESLRLTAELHRERQIPATGEEEGR